METLCRDTQDVVSLHQTVFETHFAGDLRPLHSREWRARATIPRARDDIRTGVARAQSNLHRISWRTRCGIQVKMFNARRSRQSNFTVRNVMLDSATARHRRILVVALSWPAGRAIADRAKRNISKQRILYRRVVPSCAGHPAIRGESIFSGPRSPI